MIGSALVFLKTGLSALPGVTHSANVVLGLAVLLSAMAPGVAFRFRAWAWAA